MYTFVKLENNFKGMNLQYGWCFKAASIKDIVDYNDIHLMQKIQDGVYDTIAGYKHATSVWRSAVDQMSFANGDGFLKNSMKLERDVTTGQLKSLMTFGAIYFQRCGSYLVPSEGIVELDIVEKEECMYPFEKFTVEDIKVSRWPEGKHFYAKVGSFDVKSDDGILKWNRYDDAFFEAKKFMKKLNN